MPDAERIYYWVTLRVREYGTTPCEYLEGHAIDVLPFTWLRMYRRCEDKQSRARRVPPSVFPYMDLHIAPAYHLMDFRQISKEEYEDAVANEMAWPMAALEAWYHRIGEPAEDVKQGPYR